MAVGGGGAGAVLPQGQSGPGARDGDRRGDGGLPPPLPPGLGPISNVSWHHMAFALFVLLRLRKEGSVSLSGRGGGTQAQEHARVPWDRRLSQALRISSESRVSVLIPAQDHPSSRGASLESRSQRFTHPRGSRAEPALRVRERPGAEHDRPATGCCVVGGKCGSAATDSSEHRQQFCDSDAGLAQHQKVTARSTHPGLWGAGAFSACPLSGGAAIPRTSPRPAPWHPKSQPTASPAAPALPLALPFPSLCCPGPGSLPSSYRDEGERLP